MQGWVRPEAMSELAATIYSMYCRVIHIGSDEPKHTATEDLQRSLLAHGSLLI